MALSKLVELRLDNGIGQFGADVDEALGRTSSLSMDCPAVSTSTLTRYSNSAGQKPNYTSTRSTSRSRRNWQVTRIAVSYSLSSAFSQQAAVS